MKRLLLLCLCIACSFQSFAKVIADGTVKPQGIKEVDIKMGELFEDDIVPNFIKNNKNCGQKQSVQTFKYKKLSDPGCINIGMGMVTIFSFEESIKSYVISDPENVGFFSVGVWISDEEAKDNSFVNQKNLYVKALSPQKATNIVFLAESGRQYFFDLKSIDYSSDEIPTRHVHSSLPEDLLAEVKQVEEAEKAKQLATLMESAKKINFEQDNFFAKYMEEVHGSKINLNYEMESYNNGESIRPWAVYDNGVRTFFNYDGILPTDDRPAISRVLNGIDVPHVVKDAYTLGPSYKGWLYVETISQEGFTVSLGGGENAKILCIKPTVDLRDFYNSQEKRGLQKVNFRKESVKEEVNIFPQEEEKQ